MSERDAETSNAEVFRTELTGPYLNRVGESPTPSLGRQELSFRTEVGGHNSDSVKIVVADEHAALKLDALLHAARSTNKRLILSITTEDLP